MRRAWYTSTRALSCSRKMRRRRSPGGVGAMVLVLLWIVDHWRPWRAPQLSILASSLVIWFSRLVLEHCNGAILSVGGGHSVANPRRSGRLRRTRRSRARTGSRLRGTSRRRSARSSLCRCPPRRGRRRAMRRRAWCESGSRRPATSTSRSRASSSHRAAPFGKTIGQGGGAGTTHHSPGSPGSS